MAFAPVCTAPAALAGDSLPAAPARDSFPAAPAKDSFTAAAAKDSFTAAAAKDSFTAAAAKDSFTAAPPTPVPRPQPVDLDLGPLFEVAHDAVVVADPRSGAIVRWNPAAARLFGYTESEAVGRPVHILMPPCMAKLHGAAVDRYLHTGRGLIMDADGPVEVPAVTKAGADLRIEISLSELRGPDGQRYVVAVMRDTSYRREAELMRLELDRVRRMAETLASALTTALASQALATAADDVEVDG